MTPFTLIAAIARDGAIGQAGRLPWPTLRQDMAWFRLLTTAQSPYHVAIHLAYYPRTVAIAQSSLADTLRATDQNAVILGRRAWESLPWCLPRRENIVLTSQAPPLHESYDGAVWRVASFEDALEIAPNVLYAPNVFVIGGAAVYSTALQHPDCQALYLTEIDAEYPEADTWFPTPTFSFEEMWHGEDVIWDDAPHTWHRTHVSAWITELDRPRYRFGIWHPLA